MVKAENPGQLNIFDSLGFLTPKRWQSSENDDGERFLYGIKPFAALFFTFQGTFEIFFNSACIL